MGAAASGPRLANALVAPGAPGLRTAVATSNRSHSIGERCAGTSAAVAGRGVESRVPCRSGQRRLGSSVGGRKRRLVVEVLGVGAPPQELTGSDGVCGPRSTFTPRVWGLGEGLQHAVGPVDVERRSKAKPTKMLANSALPRAIRPLHAHAPGDFSGRARSNQSTEGRVASSSTTTVHALRWHPQSSKSLGRTVPVIKHRKTGH